MASVTGYVSMFVALSCSACPQKETATSSGTRPTGDVANEEVAHEGERVEVHHPAEVGGVSERVGEASEAFSERRRERDALADVLRADGVSNPRVLAAIRKVPRHAFVPEPLQPQAYINAPLPIGSGQTISQPYIVAEMTELALPSGRGEEAQCLEIGTGSGYQAAVLAEVCKKVFSIEYLADVAATGRENLRALGYGPDRVALRVGDGYRGWPEAAPFDAILVTAAPEKVPPALLNQLAVGGKLVIPIGSTWGVQNLEVWQRLREGNEPEAFRRRVLYGVRFVPFLGEGASEP